MTESRTGYVEYPGTRLYYEVDGAGPALTLIHAGVAHLRMWDAQVAAFKDRYTVIRYDERGFGKTKTEDVPYSNHDDLASLARPSKGRQDAPGRQLAWRTDRAGLHARAPRSRALADAGRSRHEWLRRGRPFLDSGVR